MSINEVVALEGVLIVDDCPVMTHTLSSFLAANEYTVVDKAINGVEAVLSVRKYNPAIVLMDLNMPLMDGYTAIAEIKKYNPDIKIIALTAESEKASVIRAVKAGADEFLVKPVKSENLIRIIKKIEFE